MRGEHTKIAEVQAALKDHPRMRGEHSSAYRIRPETRGSSPHARGTRFFSRIFRHQSGIIPACAGNTWTDENYGLAKRDHPRMRGEHSCLIASASAARGSSPHARGTPLVYGKGGRFTGIIPACAGNTTLLDDTLRSHWDHPRMRGEHNVFSRVNFI